MMAKPAVAGIELFKIAGRSISGWIPSFKSGSVALVRQPFCSQLEERLLLWLEYHPQVKNYARGDIGSQFATRLVECPRCGATRSLAPHRGVLHFKAHDKRKSPAPVTGVRWALRATIWTIVGGEHA